jgi:RNA polymerase sigma factor (sigma-70 family)
LVRSFFEDPARGREEGEQMLTSDLAASDDRRARTATLDLEHAFTAHAEQICRFLRRLGLNAAEAEDVMAETFLVAHQRRADFDPARQVRPWLMGIASRLLLRHRRKMWLRRILSLRLEHEAAEPEPLAPDPENALLAAEDADRMRRALEKLPDKKRTLLVMRELEGLSAEEIGYALEMPEATVYSALHYARKDLLKQYRRLLALEAVR